MTEMTRLECVRRLKESQLVIKLLVRYRGALRPEVVSAERKLSTEMNKVPPELPSAPPPVPPRKLRHPRRLHDTENNSNSVKPSCLVIIFAVDPNYYYCFFFQEIASSMKFFLWLIYENCSFKILRSCNKSLNIE